MNALRRIAGCALLCGALLAAAPARAAGLVDCAATGAWLRIQSPHFTLLTTGTEADGRALARELESLAWTLDRVGWSRQCARPVAATVFVLADAGCYEQFGPHYQGRPVKTVGAFLRGPLGSMMILRVSRKESDLRTIRHEYVHTMAERRDVDLPLALNEGIADFFSTFAVAGGEVTYGHAIPQYQRILGHKPAMPTDALLGIGFGEEYFKGENRDLFYAQSWALAHYLLRNYSSGTFLRMWDRLAAGEPIRAAFRSTYPQEDWDTLGERAARFGRAVEDHLAVPHDEAAESVALTVATLSPLEVETWLGDLLVQQERKGKAQAEALYQAALARDANWGPALAGLGMIAELRGYPRESAALFARALAGRGADARTARLAAHFGARALDADSTSRNADGSLVPARWAPVRAALERSLALDPADDRALDLASRLAHGDSAFSAALVPSLEKGHAQAPGQGGIAAALAVALVESGRIERAEEVLATISARCRSDRSAGAEEALVRGHMLRAWKELSAGTSEEGKKRLIAMRARTADESLRTLIDRELKSLEGLATFNSAIDVYNAGIKLANAGKLAEAIERFEQARRQATDPGLILEAGKRIEEIRAFLKKRR